MRLFKEEQVKEIFNDATIITTKKYFDYVSNEERMAHKIKMAIQGLCVLWMLYKTGNGQKRQYIITCGKGTKNKYFSYKNSYFFCYDTIKMWTGDLLLILK